MTPAAELITAARDYIAAQEATAAYPEDEAERAEAEAKEAAARARMVAALSRCDDRSRFPIIRTGDLTDVHYERAIGVLARTNRASTSLIQRELGLGYNAAAKLMERAEHDGFVSRPDGLGKRCVLIAAPQPAPSDDLRAAMTEACDLLAERKHGSPARSPGHNARLVLERALSTPAQDAQPSVAVAAVDAIAVALASAIYRQTEGEWQPNIRQADELARVALRALKGASHE